MQQWWVYVSLCARGGVAPSVQRAAACLPGPPTHVSACATHILDCPIISPINLPFSHVQIAGVYHVHVAAHKALEKAQAPGSLTTKSLHMELLFQLGGSTHVRAGGGCASSSRWSRWRRRVRKADI